MVPSLPSCRQKSAPFRKERGVPTTTPLTKQPAIGIQKQGKAPCNDQATTKVTQIFCNRFFYILSFLAKQQERRNKGWKGFLFKCWHRCLAHVHVCNTGKIVTYKIISLHLIVNCDTFTLSTLLQKKHIVAPMCFSVFHSKITSCYEALLRLLVIPVVQCNTVHVHYVTYLYGRRKHSRQYKRNELEIYMVDAQYQ